jgi:hypothetical protein
MLALTPAERAARAVSINASSDYLDSPLGCGRGRIDQFLDFSDLGRRETADPRMLGDDAFVFGQIDAEGFVVGYKTLDPLNVRPELLQDLIRFCGRRSELFAFERADLWDVSLDDESP